jgi:hypothetical protein
MVKQKKKRNKVYSGVDASVSRPKVTRIEAVKRNPVNQWWLEKKRFAKPLIITGLVILIVIWLIFELFRVLSA